MRKIKLNLEALTVDSFVTAPSAKGEGTVLGHAPTNGAITQCRSAFDACPTGFCAPESETCETYDPALCPSIVDGCPSERGCF